MSLRFLIKVAALASTCWMSVSAALAENRIALVIGNSNYTSVTALPNPANDANAMTKFLSSAGFQVMQAPDLTQSDMRKTIGNFASMVAEKGPDTVAFVFYAGHGLQVDGENFLIPVDAQIAREADVPLQAMRLADVMNALSAIRTKASIVVLDACRNNPFSAINKTSGRGLAIVDAPNGSLVSYSTAPGFEALDGDGKNSPFTKAFLNINEERGLPIEQALKRVRQAVSEETGRQQFPWESSSLITDFSFFPTAAQEGAATKTSQSGTTAAGRSEARSVDSWRSELKSKSAREAYEIIIREDKTEAYQAYLALYPNQSVAPTVRTILERRQLVVAWYTAVTINTVASYQTFLATYGSSDFAATANRLAERALTRSVANAGAAFAAAPTCPCNQPATPAPRQNQKRGDAPAQNTNTAGSNPTTPAASNVTVYNPAPVVTTPVPVVITTPVYDPPRRRPPKGGDKPSTGTDKPPQHTGTDRPKPTGGYDRPKGNAGGSTGNTPILTRTTNNPRIQINKNIATPIQSGPSVLRQQSVGRIGTGGSMNAMGRAGGMSMGNMGGMGGMGFRR